MYVAIKGTVFDVSAKRDTYGPGGSYALLAGKDASVGTFPVPEIEWIPIDGVFVALGKSSLKVEDAIPDYSKLDASERQTLDQWHGFFTKVRVLDPWVDLFNVRCSRNTTLSERFLTCLKP